MRFRSAEARLLALGTGRSWSLTLADAGERRIAQWHVALTEVSFRFCGYGVGETDALLAKFFAYFQRGGG